MSHTMVTEQYGLPFWLDIARPAFPTLAEDLNADVAIIGGGIAGLKLARCLARHFARVVVMEGGRIGDGASGRNQGTINHAPGLSYASCINRYSRPVASALWRLGLENHRLLRTQLEEYAIECDYDPGGMFSLARRDAPGFEQTLEQYRKDHALLLEDGFDVAFLDEREAIERGGSPIFAGGLAYLADAQFHSGKYITGLALGISRDPRIRLLEHTRVHAIVPEGSVVRLAAQQGSVRASHVFLATNALAPQFVPRLEPSLRAERGQVLVTEPLSMRPCHGSFGTSMAWWREIIEPKGRYRLLFGGGRTRDTPDSLFRQFDAKGKPHPELERGGFSPSPEHQQRLNTELATIFPALAGAKVTHRWGGLQSFTADELPLFGLFDPAAQIHGMAGFSGRGNCFADVGAEFLAGKVAGKKSAIELQFGELFEPLMRVERPEAVWGPWYSSHD